MGADGGVRACTHDSHVYGNIFEEGLLEAWKRMDDWRDGSFLPKECVECKYLAGCSGGCRIEARMSGKDGMDPYATTPVGIIPRSTKQNTRILEEFAEKLLVLGPHVKIRDEEFGGVASAGAVNSMIALLNNDAVAMLRNFKSKPPVSAEKLAKDFAKKRMDMLAFLYGLFTRDILVEKPRTKN